MSTSIIKGGNEEEVEYDAYNDEENVILPGVDDLPIFANEEEKKLDLENKNRMEVISKVELEINDFRERLKVMKEHSKNVQQELDHTNSLYSAKQGEIKAESHLRQLASRSFGRSKMDSKSIQNEIESTQEQLNSVQNLIYKANEKLDEFKMQMNWNQEELEQWAMAAKQKEEDNLALQKYTRADEVKVKELNLQLEQLTKDLTQRKELLENEITETQARQMELDRIAVDFKSSHSERQTLVERWQDTINEIKRRDAEINRIGERFAVAKSERNQREATLSTQRKRLENQVNENRDVESKSDTLSRLVARKREEWTTGAQRLQEFRDELESLKNELTTAAETLVQKRSQNIHRNQLVESRRVQLERERGKYASSKEKLEEVKSSSTQVDQLAREAEEILQQREKDLASTTAALKAQKEKLFKETQLVHDLKREESRLRADVAGAKSSSRNLEAQLTQLDRESSRQQELLYNAEFQIQQIERKIARGMGERSDEEKRQLKHQIEECEVSWKEIQEKRKLLQAQLRKLVNELTTAKMYQVELSANSIKLKEKLAEKEIENKMMEEEMKKDRKAKEEIIVQNDLLKLEVKRLKDLLSAKADAVFSLENRKQQLLLSMEERKSEIMVHREVLKSELRTLQEERHAVTMDLNNRQAQVDKLKARFEAQSYNQGEDDGSHSQSYYIIQAAQKREELQRRGDEIDHQIRLVERDIRSQQLTFDHLNARNSAFRDSFQKVDIHGDDASVLKQLEDRLKLSKDELFRKKKELQRLTTDAEEDTRRFEQIESQLSRVNLQKEHLESAKQQIQEEIFNQDGHMQEYGERIGKFVEKHRVKLSESKGIDVSVLAHGTLEEKLARSEIMRDCVQVRLETWKIMKKIDLVLLYWADIAILLLLFISASIYW